MANAETGRTIAVVQARMGSARLKGKMLLPLCGRPLVDYVLCHLTALLRGRRPTEQAVLDGVVLATSDRPQDDPLAAHIRRHWPAVHLVRGQEDDVLGRFVTALDSMPAENVIRVTADCPVINAGGLRRMLYELQHTGCDIVNYLPGAEYADKGVEAVSAEALRRAWHHPSATAHDKEHVTALMYRLPAEFAVRYIDGDPLLKKGGVRLTVDTPADMEFFTGLCASMGRTPDSLTVHDIMRHLQRHPQLAAVNACAGAKTTLHESLRAAFVCHGNGRTGYGHISGALRLARVMTQQLGAGVEFIMRPDERSQRLVTEAGLAVSLLPQDAAPEDELRFAARRYALADHSCLVFNCCKADLERYQDGFAALKKEGCRLIFQDNPLPPGWRQGNLLLNALPHPDYQGYSPHEHPACYDGLQYLPLPSGFARAGARRIISPSLRRVLVALGGGDRGTVLEPVLLALHAAGCTAAVQVICGTRQQARTAQRIIKHCGLRGSALWDVRRMDKAMAQADAGISALGVTTYEMAATGLPVLLVTDNDLNSAAAAQFARIAGSLPAGDVRSIRGGHVLESPFCRQFIKSFQEISKSDVRAAMSVAHKQAVDGKGALRVAGILHDFFSGGKKS